MANKENISRTATTIAVPKHVKTQLRYYAVLKKTTKNGDVYESDREVLEKIINYYTETHPLDNPMTHPTYPSKKIETTGMAIEV